MILEKKFFLKNQNYSVFKNKNIYHIYIYNIYFFFLIKLCNTTKLKILSNKQFEISQNSIKRLSDLSDCIYQFDKYIAQFDKYMYAKIKFAGKGYKIRKRNYRSVTLVFNKAHITTIWWRNMYIKKIRKSKLYLKYTFKSMAIIKTILNVRFINIFTKKGLRISRQIVLKKKGKKV